VKKSEVSRCKDIGERVKIPTSGKGSQKWGTRAVGEGDRGFKVSGFQGVDIGERVKIPTSGKGSQKCGTRAMAPGLWDPGYGAVGMFIRHIFCRVK